MTFHAPRFCVILQFSIGVHSVGSGDHIPRDTARHRRSHSPHGHSAPQTQPFPPGTRRATDANNIFPVQRTHASEAQISPDSKKLIHARCGRGFKQSVLTLVACERQLASVHGIRTISLCPLFQCGSASSRPEAVTSSRLEVEAVISVRLEVRRDFWLGWVVGTSSPG